MARTGVTFDDIAQAATKLLSLGESPSVQRVREVLGTGSNSTIAGHLKLWKEQRSKKEGVTLPESIPKALIPPLETLWHVALEQSDSRYLAHKEDTLRKINALETERDTWKQQCSQLEGELNTVQRELASCQSQLAESQKINQGNVKQVQQLNQRIERVTQGNAELESRIDVENRIAMEKQQTLAEQHQYEKEAWKVATRELKNSLQKERERSDASEVRWLRIVDQVKQEKKQLEKKITQIENETALALKTANDKANRAQQQLVEHEKKTVLRQNKLEQQQQRMDELNHTIASLKIKHQRSEERLSHFHMQLAKRVTST